MRIKSEAAESASVKRARKKVEAELQKNAQQITGPALMKTRQVMDHWFKRHAAEKEKVPLKAKKRRFNASEYPESTSKYVQHLKDVIAHQPSSPDLKGRVTLGKTHEKK